MRVHTRGWLVVSAAVGLIFTLAVVPTTASASTATSISMGGDHSCAVTDAGGLQCWGRNFSGELGDGTNHQKSLVPVDVVGMSSGVSAVSAGGWHTCAISTSGGLKCWGSNFYGQLGNGEPNPGDNVHSNVPVDVVGLTSGVASVDAGQEHTCAVTTAGGAKCWGRNTFGQLGDTTTNDSSVPVDVDGLTSGVSAIAAGWGHSCAITDAGALKCWGKNDYGQLGDGTLRDHRHPVDVVGLSSGVVAVSLGTDHTCALTDAGAVMCWGYNQHGTVGDGTLQFRRVPRDVVGLSSGVASIVAGGNHTCAVTDAGAVKCWGYNQHGQLGNGTRHQSRVPVDVVGLSSGMTAVSAGFAHTCASTFEGEIRCWGQNQYGPLGDGTKHDRRQPVDVIGFVGP